MSELIKVEIADLDTKEWQWLGKLSRDSLEVLTALASKLSDIDCAKEQPSDS